MKMKLYSLLFASLFFILFCHQINAQTCVVNSTADANSGTGAFGTFRYCLLNPGAASNPFISFTAAHAITTTNGVYQVAPYTGQLRISGSSGQITGSGFISFNSSVSVDSLSFLGTGTGACVTFDVGSSPSTLSNSQVTGNNAGQIGVAILETGTYTFINLDVESFTGDGVSITATGPVNLTISGSTFGSQGSANVGNGIFAAASASPISGSIINTLFGQNNNSLGFAGLNLLGAVSGLTILGSNFGQGTGGPNGAGIHFGSTATAISISNSNFTGNSFQGVLFSGAVTQAVTLFDTCTFTQNQLTAVEFSTTVSASLGAPAFLNCIFLNNGEGAGASSAAITFNGVPTNVVVDSGSITVTPLTSPLVRPGILFNAVNSVGFQFQNQAGSSSGVVVSGLTSDLIRGVGVGNTHDSMSFFGGFTFNIAGDVIHIDGPTTGLSLTQTIWGTDLTFSEGPIQGAGLNLASPSSGLNVFQANIGAVRNPFLLVATDGATVTSIVYSFPGSITPGPSVFNITGSLSNSQFLANDVSGPINFIAATASVSTSLFQQNTYNTFLNNPGHFLITPADTGSIFNSNGIQNSASVDGAISIVTATNTAFSLNTFNLNSIGLDISGNSPGVTINNNTFTGNLVAGVSIVHTNLPATATIGPFNTFTTNAKAILVPVTLGGLHIVNNVINGNTGPNPPGIDVDVTGPTVVGTPTATSQTNAPILNNATLIGGIITVSGTFLGQTATNYFIDVYCNLVTPAEALLYLSSQTIVTSLIQPFAFAVTLPALTCVGGNFITATATSGTNLKTGEISNTVPLVQFSVSPSLSLSNNASLTPSTSLGVSPNASSPGASSPGASSPGASSPGASSPGASSPGASSPGASSPGASSPGASSPGASSPGASSPGASSPGASSPGASSPGASSPGASSPGASSPGASSPAASASATSSLSNGASPSQTSTPAASSPAASPSATSSLSTGASPSQTSTPAASSPAASPSATSSLSNGASPSQTASTSVSISRSNSASRSRPQTPSASHSVGVICRDGTVEAGEDCDFGSQPKSFYVAHCCNRASCQFRNAGTACGPRPANTATRCVSFPRCNARGVCRPAVVKVGKKCAPRKVCNKQGRCVAR